MNRRFILRIIWAAIVAGAALLLAFYAHLEWQADNRPLSIAAGAVAFILVFFVVLFERDYREAP